MLRECHCGVTHLRDVFDDGDRRPLCRTSTLDDCDMGEPRLTDSPVTHDPVTTPVVEVIQQPRKAVVLPG